MNSSVSIERKPDHISKKKLYACLFIPWPIAGFAVLASFSNQYSILLSAVAVIVEIILVLDYRKKIDVVINKESYNEKETPEEELQKKKHKNQKY